MTLQLGPVIGKVGGAQLEEIPVSMSGGGNGTVYPLATVDAGDGALVTVTGLMSAPTTSSASRPHLTVGENAHTEPARELTNGGWGLTTLATGAVQVAVLSRSPLSISFNGTVYVVRL